MRKLRRQLFRRGAAAGTVAMAALLAGCRTKPPPTRAEIQQQALPNVPLNQSWKAAPVSPDVIQDNWLATFHDAQLDALVREAITNNPDLRVAAVRVQQAAEYVELAKAEMKPHIGVLGTGGFKGGGGSDVTSALQGVMIAASWEPDLWGRLRYARNAAKESYAAAQADFEGARQSLAATVARSWFVATETFLQKRITSEMVESAAQLLSLTETRARVGSASEQDVAMARASLSGYEDAMKKMELAHTQALRALELLLGRYPSAELAARTEFTGLPGAVPAGMPLEMLERRPDMIAAERRVAAAFNRVGEARAARLPKITLNISGAVISSSVLQLKSDFQNPTAGAGARLVAPIYSGGALNTQVRIRNLEQQEAVAEYARMALSAINEVESALATGQILADRTQILEQAVTDQTRAFTLTQTSYRVGRADLRSVQQQQLNVHAARLELLHVQSEELAQRVNLHLALGGSFEEPIVQTEAKQK
jgi:NodT family efflux transporter outer membrane factor (OMF) lipoprotein